MAGRQEAAMPNVERLVLITSLGEPRLVIGHWSFPSSTLTVSRVESTSRNERVQLRCHNRSNL